jgi:Protein of unknown function (DUF2917)
MECCLAKGELIRLDGGPGGVILRCSGGTVWLTCGDGADYLISAGRSIKLPAHSVAVAEALEPAGFCLGEPAAAGDMLHRPVIGFALC